MYTHTYTYIYMLPNLNLQFQKSHIILAFISFAHPREGNISGLWEIPDVILFLYLYINNLKE